MTAKPEIATCPNPVTDDEVRDAVGFIKAQFLGWKSPPVQLPADSVIEMVAREILLRGWKRGYEDA